jgi:3',5'-cyclic AMP phosphodiesterase CpdA
MTSFRLVHLSDLHFGAYVDLEQIAVLERLIPELAPAAIVVSGDVTQRARHGEFQRALAFFELCRRTAPTLLVPGNHDVRWWASPFGVRGEGPKYRHFRRYFGDLLGPVLTLPQVVIVGTLSAHGLSAGSVTWNPRDLTVKGHLPDAEVERARGVFAKADPAAWRVLVLHHNVLRGQISNRWGLARPHRTQERLIESGADVVLCGHDHQESVGQLNGRTVVVAASTPTFMTRGKRPSVFNLLEIDRQMVLVKPQRWIEKRFQPGEVAQFPRVQTRSASQVEARAD